jgi:DNA primase
MLDKIIESCTYLLNNFPGAQECRDYLDSRLDRKSQEFFNFGYFPDAKNINVLIDMVGEDTLIREKLLWHKNIEDSLGYHSLPINYFENNPLVMPFKNTYGKNVAIVGRTLLSGDDLTALNEELGKMGQYKAFKYKNTQETSSFKKGNLLFGLYENKQDIIDKNCVYVVEGQFDVIKAVEKGFKNIVALGTSNMSNYQFSVISRYTDNIFLLLDNDNAGEKGRKAIINRFGKFANIQNFFLPDSYKDIDEYLTKSNDESISFVIKG